MAATSLIQYRQGATTGVAGQVLVGIAGTPVTVQNSSNAGVLSWEIDMVYTPPGSSVSVATPLAFNDNDSTPTASFTPDVRGCYRHVLKTWSVPGRAGIPNIDIRNFVVKTPHGYVIPPYQKDPDPLPTVASNLPGNKPNELNINGHEFGWEGLTGDGLLADLIDAIESAASGGGGVVRLTTSAVLTPNSRTFIGLVTSSITLTLWNSPLDTDAVEVFGGPNIMAWPVTVTSPTITTTSSLFTMPAPGLTVSVPMTSSSLLAPGQFIFISGNRMLIMAVPDGSHATCENLDDVGNVSTGTTVGSGALVLRPIDDAVSDVIGTAWENRKYTYDISMGLWRIS